MSALQQVVTHIRICPATRQRYQRLYNEFRNWIGDDRLLQIQHRVPALLQHLGRLALNNQLSRARTAGAAVAFFWRTQFTYNPTTDPAYTAFMRGLRDLQPLLSEPSPRRNELPVWALVHFHSHPPADLDNDTHTLICAALAYGMRGLQRGGQIADLECCDISTIELRTTAVELAGRHAAGSLAIRAIIRMSKTDQNGLRPQDIVIDRGVSTVDPVLLLESYIRLRFNIALCAWNASAIARSKEKFFTSHGRAISTDSLRIWVRLVASHAGLQGRYGSHSLRIAGACWAALGGLSLETIMAMGGWRSQSSTVIYLRSLIAAVAGASGRMGF